MPTFLVTKKGESVLLWICARILSLLLMILEARMRKGTIRILIHIACVLFICVLVYHDC